MPQAHGGSRQTVERGGMLFTKAREVMKTLFRRRGGRQEQIEAVLYGGWKVRRKRRQFAHGASPVPIGKA